MAIEQKKEERRTQKGWKEKFANNKEETQHTFFDFGVIYANREMRIDDMSSKIDKNLIIKQPEMEHIFGILDQFGIKIRKKLVFEGRLEMFKNKQPNNSPTEISIRFSIIDPKKCK